MNYINQAILEIFVYFRFYVVNIAKCAFQLHLLQKNLLALLVPRGVARENEFNENAFVVMQIQSSKSSCGLKKDFSV